MLVEQPASVHSRSSAGLALLRTLCGDILSHAVPQLPYTSAGASAPTEIFGLGISASRHGQNFRIKSWRLPTLI